jgi:hypothetical protein
MVSIVMLSGARNERLQEAFVHRCTDTQHFGDRIGSRDCVQQYDDGDDDDGIRHGDGECQA